MSEPNTQDYLDMDHVVLARLTYELSLELNRHRDQIVRLMERQNYIWPQIRCAIELVNSSTMEGKEALLQILRRCGCSRME